MVKGDFDGVFELFQKFDLNPEYLKEHFEILLEFHSKSENLPSSYKQSS